MRFFGVTIVVLMGLGVACVNRASDPSPTPQVVAAMPDTIECDKAVVIEARDANSPIEAELRWLRAFFPRHGRYQQSFREVGGRDYDILTFTRANGRPASVCFDISKFFGRWRP